MSLEMSSFFGISLIFQLSDAAVKLMDGELRCRAGAWILFL